MLMALIVIPDVGLLLYVAGLALVALAVKKISDSLGEPSIFRDMLLSIILAASGLGAALISAAALGLSSLVQLIATIQPGLGAPLDPTDPRLLSLVTRLLAAFLAALIILWAFLIASSLFLRRSYKAISKRLGSDLFSATGILYMAGSALTIALVGLLILFVALILQVIAFFTMPVEAPEQPASQAGSAP